MPRVTRPIPDPTDIESLSTEQASINGPLDAESASVDEQPNIDTHHVGTDRDLQTVIDNSNPHDRLIIENGHRYSAGTTIDKPLHLEWPNWQDHDEENLIVDGLSTGEDAVTIDADNVTWDGGIVYISDGSGRDAIHVSGSGSIYELYTPRIGARNAGRKGIHLDDGTHHRFGTIIVDNCNAQGYHAVDGSLNNRMFGRDLKVVGCGGPNSVPAVEITNINAGDVQEIIGAGGSDQFGGDAYQGVFFGVDVRFLSVGSLFAEDTLQEGVALKTDTSGRAVSYCDIGTIKAVQVGKDSGIGVNIGDLTRSSIGTIRQSPAGSSAATGLRISKARNCEIGVVSAVDGTNMVATGLDRPTIHCGYAPPNGDADTREQVYLDGSHSYNRIVQWTDGVSTTATPIFEYDSVAEKSQVAQTVFVAGLDEADNTVRFADLLLTTGGGGVTVVSSNERGTPAGRTYTEDASAVSLEMASDTYNVATVGSSFRVV